MNEQLGYGTQIRRRVAAVWLVTAVAALPGSRLTAGPITNPPFTYVTNPTGGTPIPLGGYTFGSQFTIGTQAVAVIHLGYWDQGSDGLLEDHAVGIWDMSNTLLTSATVPSGAVAPLTNGFRWVTLSTPLILYANTSYVLGGFTGTLSSGDPLFYAPTTFTIDPLLTFDQARFQPSPSGLQDPTTAGDFALGPNVAGAVPEPSSSAILVLAAVAAWCCHRKTSNTRRLG